MLGRELVVVQTFGNRPEADLAQSRLEAEGIDAMVQADNVGGMGDNIAWSGDGFRVLVRAEDEAAARDVLSPGEPGEVTDDVEAGAEEQRRID